MINDQEKIIAIIPARAGSKRLPGKNTLPFVGRPCIQWTIDAAIGCRRIDDVVVSTDDSKVSELVSVHEGLQLIHRSGSDNVQVLLDTKLAKCCVV